MRSTGVLTDLRYFFRHKPAIPTSIDLAADERRENFSLRIRQRLGISVDRYAILNIHKIGIAAPVGYVFQELLQWSGDSTCWPNHVASAERVGPGLDHIRILLGGRRVLPFGLGRRILGVNLVPLFNLKAARIQSVPQPADVDNARYVLFECSGGYPIGVFAMYVRSQITQEGEVDRCQLFLVAGFNFYGKERLSHLRPVRRIWETVHNRVTGNVMNRFKQLCEWRFSRTQAGA